jgi:predicted PurR-regulated permease PerM/methylmalonyl-CoA mutase cobalamin-binding subunit
VAALALIAVVLSVARAVVVPLALAVLLAFVLTPAAERLERWRVRRALAVALVMALALGAVGGFGYVLGLQFVDLSARLADYSGSVRGKVAGLRGAGGGTLDRLQQTVDTVSEALEDQVADTRGAARPVRVVPSDPTPVERFQATVAPVLEPLAMAGIVVILVAFMLAQRDDLRNRLIRLVGKGRLTLTTRTLDEVGQRVSRFLVTQLLINAGFGALVTAGLAAIGVPYALLWGALTVVLRFVPYIGSAIALVLPALLAFAVFPGWRETLLTVALFLALDVLAAYVVEPLVVGHRTGVSSMALLVSALFWTWLWGPAGLLLSTPITVCLAVLGRHVRELEFLGILLGDEPALETDVSFYQRLVAGDEDEAGEIVERQLATHPVEDVFDRVIVPALALAERDRLRREIADDDYEFVVAAARRIVEAVEPPPAGAAGPGDRPRAHVLAVAARADADDLGTEMLARLFAPLACEVERVGSAALASELIERAGTSAPDLVCLLALPPGGVAHARYALKRLRSRFAAMRLVVVRPGAGDLADTEAARLREAGADEVVSSLTAARTFATALLASALVRPAPTTGDASLAVAGAEG